jgi:leucine dehydrogenase
MRGLEVDRVVLWHDAASGLEAILVIDDLTLGPAAGGVRTRAYG